MENGAYLAIGAAIGAGISALGSFINSLLLSRSQKELSEFNAKRDLERDRLKYEHETTAKIKERLILSLEKMHLQLSSIAHYCSLTGNSIQYSNEITIAQYNQLYSDQCMNISEVNMLLNSYVPQYNISTNALENVMNHYWGNYKELIRHRLEGNDKAAQKALDKVVPYSNEVVNESEKLKRSIRSIASQVLA